MTHHVDAETLARFRQEDLSRRRASSVRAHLAGCERCRALDEELAGVTTLLADVQPPPMPEYLVARIQTALAAEAARRVALAADARPAAGGIDPDAAPEPGLAPGARTRHERPRHGRRQPWLAGLSSPVALRTMAAAAAVVVLGGGVYEISQHAGASSSSSAPLVAPAEPHAQAPNVGAGSSAALPRPDYLQAGNREVPVIASGTNYAPATLRDRVRNKVTLFGAAKLPGPGVARSPLATAGGSAEMFGISAATLADCITRIAAGQRVLLVDVARYRGTPATVIVTGALAGGPEQVWVVGRGCSSTSSAVLAHVTLAPAG